MENTPERQLSFPQRNWFLLCILVAILSPLLVHFIQVGAKKRIYQQSTEIRFTDTSNKVASPPQTSPARKQGSDSTDSTRKP